MTINLAKKNGQATPNPMTTIYVTSFNHNSLDGIAEIAELLTDEFKQAGFRVIYCRSLPSEIASQDVLIVADEFSEPLVVEALWEFKEKHPEFVLVCVLTEFFTAGDRFRPSGLNNFKEPVQSFLFDNLLYVYSHLSKRLALYRKLQFQPPAFVNYTIAFFALLWLVLLKIRKLRTPFRQLVPFHERAYLWFRMLGLLNVSEMFDFYLMLHPNIRNEALAAALRTESEKIQLLLVTPPPIDQQMLVNPQLKFGIDYSGSLNAYRKRELRKVRKLLSKLSPTRRFVRYFTRGFDDTKMEYYVSFNPPQSRTWRYSSPMRIIGAIKRGQIPIVRRKFGDHPAEELAVALPSKPKEALSVLTSLIYYNHFYLDSAWDKLRQYRNLAQTNNQEVIRLIMGARKTDRAADVLGAVVERVGLASMDCLHRGNS